VETTQYVVAPRGSRHISLPALLAYVMALPQVGDQCDALYVPQGLGENNRVKYAVGMWERYIADHLLVAGSYSREPGWFETSVDVLTERFGLTRTRNVHTQPEGINTPAQTKWAAETCKREGITSIALVAPAYHMLRQLLSLHVALKRVGLQIPVIPTPLPVPPRSLTAATLAGESDLTAISMVDGELDRIERYMKLGDLATTKQYCEYLDWLWEQPIIPKLDY
jgi:hypothetical protein